MDPPMDPSSYAARLDAFRRSDAERDALVVELVKEVSELKLKYDEQTDDYNNEVASRRMWQAKAAQSEKALTQQKQASTSHNFVLALIDGDGAIFQDYLYAMGGKEGGAEAAHQIHTELSNHLKSLYPDLNVPDWNIVVQVVLNLPGLASKLQSCSIINSMTELQAFARSFSLAQPLFSFVDVGSGKERADHKIRETLRLYLPNAQCKHVFFGPCHDNGYLPVLEPLRRDAAVASRITLLETSPAEPGFKELGLKRLRLSRTFRDDDLPALRPAGALSPAVTATSWRTPSGIHGNSTTFVPKSTGPASSTDSAASSVTNSASWATIGKVGAAAKSISIAPKKSAPARSHILLNADDERLDPELPRTDSAAEARFYDRLNSVGKVCNDYYLLGKCAAGEYCDYLHSERLTPGELLVLRYKARGRSCPRRQGCTDIDCIFGHHCKFGRSCYLENCWFANTHNMDLTPAKRLYEDGTEEWLPGYLQNVGA